MTNTLQAGRNIESLAVEYLQNAGILILHRNFRCRYGEIDIIAAEQDCLLFIEVRFRKNSDFGHPTETVTFDKQQKIIATAGYYLQCRAWAAVLACRFDVIAVQPAQNMYTIDWIKDAFHA